MTYLKPETLLLQEWQCQGWTVTIEVNVSRKPEEYYSVEVIETVGHPMPGAYICGLGAELAQAVGRAAAQLKDHGG